MESKKYEDIGAIIFKGCAHTFLHTNAHRHLYFFAKILMACERAARAQGQIDFFS
jgi:hypothetical protein